MAALAECGKVLGLLSLAAALLLLAQALPFNQSRHRGSHIADLLLAAFTRLDSVGLRGLATRGNMVLLCHAILLVLLRDAGLLSTPARRRQSAEPTFPHIKNAVAVEKPQAALMEPEDEGGVEEHVGSTKDGVLLVEEKKQGNDIDDRNLVATTGELDQPAAVDGKITNPLMDFGRALAADQEKNGAEEEEVEPVADEREEDEEDLDEMNRRFEAFIADTKAKMRLEALRPSVGFN